MAVGSSSEAREVKIVVDTLVIADSLVAGLQLEGAFVYFLQKNQGIREVRRLVCSNYFNLQEYKFVVLLCGKADLTGVDSAFEGELEAVISLIHEQNNKMFVVLTAALLSPHDQRFQI